MSAASIDRYLKPAKATDQIRGVSTTKPSLLLRSSIKIRKAGNEVEAEPGFFEGDRWFARSVVFYADPQEPTHARYHSAHRLSGYNSVN